ncbi:MAG: Type 1 glutamine amidotransferase-like domain-containing protein [Candidatus Pacebacteria bacterium]|nr:Type 1 glutamine amidotransferase-like domain-containing protein [Candidatus Paceibacterota bacterium]
MKRILLFSKQNEEKIFNMIFSSEIKNRILAYMPSHMPDCSPKYIQDWMSYAKRRNAKFNLIDNSKINNIKEQNKLFKSNILVLTGGNTFQFLYNIRKSGLDKTIKKFSEKDEFIIAGFSAGAIILTPSIKIAELPNHNSNLIGLKDLTGLGFVDFEVFPHYSEEYEKNVEEYKKNTKYEVKTIIDGGHILIDL